MSFVMSPLKDLLLKVDKWNPAKEAGDSLIKYIDLSSVDKDSKRIIDDEVQELFGSKAPSRARQLVSEKDILVATVRPNLNGVASVPGELEGATASTGYCVLRVNEELLDSKYLFYWVQTELFVNDMISKASGANYPAVSDQIIKDSKIPLPPLEEQKRIAAILDKADAIRQKRKQAIELADEFLRSVFLDMFGDPVTNPKGWGWSSVGEYIEYIGDIGSNGSNAVVAKNLDMLDSEDFALMVRTVNLNANDFSNNAKYISKETYDFFKKSKVYGGEIIMNKIGSAGQFWIMPNLNRPVSLGLNQFVIRLKNINTNFLYYYLSTEFGHAKIAESLRGAVTKSITKTAVKELPIYTPTLALQEKFSDVVSATQSTRKKLHSKDADSLFETLSQKAFSGQL